MAGTKRIAKVACGAAAALAAVVAVGADGAAQAKSKSRSRGGALSVLTISVAGRAQVPANEIIDIGFSSAIDPASINPATIQVRALNATQTGYTKQAFGSFQVSGNIVRFYPRLPGHLRDANGKFFTEGSPNDDAAENAGLQPSTKYQVLCIGRPYATTVRSSRGRPLRISTYTRFTTASASDPAILYTSQTFSDSPPPQVSFSNPSDTVPSAATQYATRGGTKGVANDISLQLYCTRVPLSIATARVPGNVQLTLVERYGNPLLRRPVQGTVFIEQNFETSLLNFKPRFPLADRAEYLLRISKNVKDLTEQYDFLPNRERDRLRQIYEFLSAERAIAPPGTPAEDLADPPQSLVGDWPSASNTVARGVLKANVLALGDAYPDEMDPRVMLLFTTRDEPVTNAEFRIEFLKSEGLFDGQLSTGEYDLGVPGAASAIFTASGGSAADGDFLPTSSTTLNAAVKANHTFNFRDVVIPQGVTITVTGTRPVTIKAITFRLDGTINLNGSDGKPGTQGCDTSGKAITTPAPGGNAGPGGGKGASGGDVGTLSDWWYGGGTASSPGSNGPYRQKSGAAGSDTDGNNPTLVGGAGGEGGSAATGSATGYTYSYGYGGGGGGGGAADVGTKGGNASWTGTPYSAWNGLGGAGGAMATVSDLNPLFGGSGGGASGSAGLSPDYGTYYGAYDSGGSSGGGGGGAMMVQTAKALTIGTTGVISAVGGNGGAYINCNYGETGGGGGASGGSILLRSTGGFNLPNPTQSLNVAGGKGAAGGSYSGKGGDGAVGFKRAEFPPLPSGLPAPDVLPPGKGVSNGEYNPAGGGVPSYVYTKWADLGVDDPRILPWTNADVGTQPTLNDAIYVQVQMTKEDPNVFGTADTSEIDGNQDSTNTAITSPWVPVKIHDRTGLPGTGAFTVPDYNPGSDGLEYAGFDISELNDHGYRFIRYRIFFQLDQSQRYADPVPNVEFISVHYQYNL